MDFALLLVVGVPLAWHAGLVGYTYYDAGRSGMNAAKWATIAFLVPLFGFFAYLFERSERDYDPEEDPYAGGGYNVHESRAEDLEFRDSRNDDADLDGASAREGVEVHEPSTDDGRDE